jgi:hypothetical protein
LSEFDSIRSKGQFTLARDTVVPITQLNKQVSTGLLNEVFDCIDLANHVGMVGRQARDFIAQCWQ